MTEGIPAGRVPVRGAARWLAVAIVLVAAPAHAQLFTDTESRKAIAAQRETIAAQQQQIVELTRLSGELSARINQVENVLKAQSLLEVLNQVTALQGELRALRGQQEVLGNAIDTATRRQRDMYIDIDSRLKRIESATPPAAATGVAPPLPGSPPPGAATPVPGTAAAPAVPAGPGAVAGSAAQPPAAVAGPPPAGTNTASIAPAGRGPVVVPPTPAQTAVPGSAPVPGGANTPAAPAVASTADAAAEQRAYDAAHQLRRIGNYAGAISGFQSFVKTWPKSRLAPAAQYWVGDSHFNLREFRVAIASQRQLLSTWPDTDKAPDALLNIASSQAELGEGAAARKTLEELIARFPTSEAAERAKRRLAGRK